RCRKPTDHAGARSHRPASGTAAGAAGTPESRRTGSSPSIRGCSSARSFPTAFDKLHELVSLGFRLVVRKKVEQLFAGARIVFDRGVVDPGRRPLALVFDARRLRKNLDGAVLVDVRLQILKRDLHEGDPLD